MSRAKWKGPYFYKTNISISRNSEVLPYFVGLTVSVYNGKKVVNVKVTSEMVGHKFGEFVPTRVKFIFKKRKLKKKQYGTKNKS